MNMQITFREMNVTMAMHLGNSNAEVVFGHFFLAATSIFIHGYALFLCNAIFDFQNEKPNHDKSPFDNLIQDMMNFQFFMILSNLILHIIGLFTPPVFASSLLYLIVHLFIFFRHFNAASYLVTLYAKYVFIFQPDKFENIPTSILRKKVFAWKILLTIIATLISIVAPIEEVPFHFRILTKENSYERYFLGNYNQSIKSG